MKYLVQFSLKTTCSYPDFLLILFNLIKFCQLKYIQLCSLMKYLVQSNLRTTCRHSVNLTLHIVSLTSRRSISDGFTTYNNNNQLLYCKVKLQCNIKKYIEKFKNKLYKWRSPVNIHCSPI